MNLMFNRELAENYQSQAQKIRIMSETWMEDNMYCPCCGFDALKKQPNNKPVADFYCENCGEIFELKSKNGPLGKKIVDGAYTTAIQRVMSNSNPDLFVLQYHETNITKLTIVPKYFFTTNILEKRKPLAQTARRAGWVGSNILYSEIPTQGKIVIIDNGFEIDKSLVIQAYAKAKHLQTNDLINRSWLLDVLQCINLIPESTFTLKRVYDFTDLLAMKHPGNRNIHAKIRQQLQILRDKGYVLFLGNGTYRKQ